MDSCSNETIELQNRNCLTEVPLNSNCCNENETELTTVIENDNNEQQNQQQLQTQQQTNEIESTNKAKSNSLQRFIDSVIWKKKSHNTNEDVVTIGSETVDYKNNSNGGTSSSVLSLSEGGTIKSNSLTSRRLHFRVHKKTTEKQTLNNTEQQQQQQDNLNSENRKSLRRLFSEYWNTIFRKTSRVNNTVSSEPTSNVKDENQIPNQGKNTENVSNIEVQELIERTEVGLNLNEKNIIQETALTVG